MARTSRTGVGGAAFAWWAGRPAPDNQSLGPDEGAAAQLVHRLLEFGLRAHHDRPVPGDWLLDWFAGHEQEANNLRAGLPGSLVAGGDQAKGEVADTLPH